MQKSCTSKTLSGQRKGNVKMKKTMTSITMLAMALALSGCLTSITAETKKQLPDGSVTLSRVSVFGTGDKVAQSAAEGLFADGGDDVLGAGVRKASAKQESTGIAETFAGVGNMMTGMANFMAATQGVKPPAAAVSTAAATAQTAASPTVAPAVEATAADEELQATVAVLKPVTSVLPSATTSAALAAKMAEAKASGKPLVVIAGSPECGYCVRLENTLNGSAFLARTDIVVYREMNEWASNAALTWTGGGNAPILRVTRWDASGKAVYDKKVNRPQTIAEIEAAIIAK